jgi:DNA-binding MarR family transcriptional regulator
MASSSAKLSAPAQQRRIDPVRTPAMTAADEEMWALLDESGLSDHISFMMRLAQLALLEHVFSKQNSIDLSFSQLTILRLIHTRPELTQQRIADAMRIKKANLTPLVNELVTAGLVTRKNAVTNRKAYALHLTRKGDRALSKATGKLATQLNPMTAILNPNEREQLLRSLRKIVLRLPPLSGLEKNLRAEAL